MPPILTVRQASSDTHLVIWFCMFIFRFGSHSRCPVSQEQGIPQCIISEFPEILKPMIAYTLQEEKFHQNLKFCYFVYGKFAKFKFCLLLYFLEIVQ